MARAQVSRNTFHSYPCSQRHLLPDLTIKFDAVGGLRPPHSVGTDRSPLLEEEGKPSAETLITYGARPFCLHRPRSRTRFPPTITQCMPVRSILPRHSKRGSIDRKRTWAATARSKSMRGNPCADFPPRLRAKHSSEAPAHRRTRQALGTLGEDLEAMLRRGANHIKDTLDKIIWDIFMKEVTH